MFRARSGITDVFEILLFSKNYCGNMSNKTARRRAVAQGGDGDNACALRRCIAIISLVFGLYIVHEHVIQLKELSRAHVYIDLFSSFF